MTFAAPDWGSANDVSTAIFNEYVDTGGNFVDTAAVYGGGHSKEIIGSCIAERSLRDQVVAATKFHPQQPARQSQCWREWSQKHSPFS